MACEDGDAQGLQTLRSADIPFLELRDWDMCEAVLMSIMGTEPAEYLGYRFQNLVVDSYSVMGKFWMKKGLKLRGQKDMVPKDGFDPRNIYMYAAEKGRQTNGDLLSLRCNVVLMCRETQMKEKIGDKEGDVITWPAPMLPGEKLPQELPGEPDATIRMLLVNGKRMFQTGVIGRVQCRVRVDRTKVQLPLYVEPHLGGLLRVMRGDLSGLELLKPKATARETTPIANR